MPQPTHLDAVLHNARALRSDGDLAAARHLLEHALDTARTAYGEDHPDILAAARLLAGVLREAGEPAAARRVLEEALSAGKVRLGEADPLMLGLAFDLGTVADELGNRHEARRNFDLVAAAGPAVLGQDDPAVRAARDYLAGQSLPPANQEANPPANLEPNPPANPNANPRLNLPANPRPAPRAPAIMRSRTRVRAFGGPLLAVVAALVTATAGLGAAALIGSHLGGDPARPDAAGASAGTPADGSTNSPADGSTNSPADGSTNSSADGSTGRPVDAPPTGLKLTRRGGSITLSWTDPTAGTVPFIVAGAPEGQARHVLASLDPGDTRSTLNGLNPDLEYCFTILAVYASNRLVAGEPACTARRPQPHATR